MSFLKQIKPAPQLIPRFNTGACLDIPTGHIAVGMKGESIVNGGFHHLEGGTGEANSVKTGLELYRILIVISRYLGSEALIADIENTLPRDRLLTAAKQLCPELVNEDGSIQGLELTTRTEYNGDKLFAEIKKYGEERPKLKADYIDTPFIDPDTKKPISILAPVIAFIDSLTKLNFTGTEDIQDKSGISGSGQNMLYMHDGLLKTRMLDQMSNISVKHGLYFVMTAQLGEVKQLDPYSAPRQTLSFLKGNLKLKRVPDDYRYGLHNLWYNFKMKALLNSSTKAPEYPRNSDENNDSGDTDLQEVITMNLRGKSGASGKPITLIYSQSEGLKASLTEFHNAKTANFGITNSKGNYTIDLYPECKVGRTTIRNALETDKKLQTAVKLTSDLLQVKEEWRHLPEGYVCDPKTLYDDIKAKGYDWNVLLETRSYWTFDQYTHPVPFLSIIDLLNMRAGTYTPYWLENNNDKKPNK